MRRFGLAGEAPGICWLACDEASAITPMADIVQVDLADVEDVEALDLGRFQVLVRVGPGYASLSERTPSQIA